MQLRTKTAIITYAVILGLALLSKWTERTSGAYSSSTSRSVARIMKNAQRWDAVSRQDNDHLTALMHSAYALAYAQVALTLLPEPEVERASGIDVKTFENSVEQFQSQLIAELR